MDDLTPPGHFHPFPGEDRMYEVCPASHRRVVDEDGKIQGARMTCPECGQDVATYHGATIRPHTRPVGD